MPLFSRTNKKIAADQPPPPPAGEGKDGSPKLLKSPSDRRPRFTAQAAVAGTANLANLLPTGTLLAFRFLAPAFTNRGSCDPATRALTAALLLALTASAAVACFTDSLSHGGQVYYGLATLRGLWLFDGAPDGVPEEELARKRLRPVDFVHAALSALVFGVVAAGDANVVGCFYPRPGTAARELLDLVPLGVGVACGLLFLAFPTTRHGIGYPVASR